MLHVTLVDSGTNTLVGTGANSSGRITVADAGSRLDLDGRLGIATTRAVAAGEVIVSNGAALNVGGFLQLGQFSGANPGTLSHLLITGADTILCRPTLGLS